MAHSSAAAAAAAAGGTAAAASRGRPGLQPSNSAPASWPPSSLIPTPPKQLWFGFLLQCLRFRGPCGQWKRCAAAANPRLLLHCSLESFLSKNSQTIQKGLLKSTEGPPVSVRTPARNTHSRRRPPAAAAAAAAAAAVAAAAAAASYSSSLRYCYRCPLLLLLQLP